MNEEYPPESEVFYSDFDYLTVAVRGKKIKVGNQPYAILVITKDEDNSFLSYRQSNELSHELKLILPRLCNPHADVLLRNCYPSRLYSDLHQLNFLIKDFKDSELAGIENSVNLLRFPIITHRIPPFTLQETAQHRCKV